MQAQLHAFLTSTLEGSVVNFTPLPSYPSIKGSRYPSHRRLYALEKIKAPDYAEDKTVFLESPACGLVTLPNTLLKIYYDCRVSNAYLFYSIDVNSPRIIYGRLRNM